MSATVASYDMECEWQAATLKPGCDLIDHSHPPSDSSTRLSTSADIVRSSEIFCVSTNGRETGVLQMLIHPVPRRSSDRKFHKDLIDRDSSQVPLQLLRA